MQAGEEGVRITIETGETLTSFASADLKVVLETGGAVRTLTMTISGTTAYRDTVTTDFPSAGVYKCQLVVIKPGVTLKSPVFKISVGESL